MTSPEDVLSYWFDDLGAADYPRRNLEMWWKHQPEVDETIRQRFGGAIDRAAEGALAGWCDTPRGTLALIIVMDQFTRNCRRGTPGMYALDDEAQDLALRSLDAGVDTHLTYDEKGFIYMPFMHAENVALQRLCVRLFERQAACARPADKEVADNSVDYARRHLEIVERFGRFPHRNEILGRASTPEEIEFLKQPNSSF